MMSTEQFDPPHLAVSARDQSPGLIDRQLAFRFTK